MFLEKLYYIFTTPFTHRMPKRAALKTCVMKNKLQSLKNVNNWRGVDPTRQFSFPLVSTIAKCLIFGIMVFSTFLNPNGFAQTAPDLGSAVRFGLLAGDSIRATDTVKVFGNAGALNAINSKVMADSVFVSGTKITVALSDINTAQAFMAAQSGTSISGLLGGQTLNAGVYTISGDAVLSDTLTLQGDTGSVFIFNIGSNLNIDSHAVIYAKGKVNAKNIYWNVAGNVTIGSNSFFSGIVISGSNINIKGKFVGMLACFATNNIDFKGKHNPMPLPYFSLVNGCVVKSPANFNSAARADCAAPIATCGDAITNGNLEAYYTEPPYYMCNEEVNTTGGFAACQWDALPYLHGTITPDYFNTCVEGSTTTGIPLNAYGTQMPHSGNGYAGLFSGQSPNYVEEGILHNIGGMTAGRVYVFEMYANLAESSKLASSMGFQIRDSSMVTTFSYYHPSAITDKANWTPITTCYTATGTEMMIWVSSHVVDYQQVPTVSVPSGPGTYPYSSTWFPFAYYYIDDISLRPLAVAGGNKTICGLSTNVGDAVCAISGASYQWTKVSGPGTVTFVNSTSANTNVSFSQSGTYQLMLSATLNGCTDTEIITVTAQIPPSVTIVPPIPSICSGSSVTLSAAGAASYLWSTGATSSSIIVSPTAATTYSVKGTTNGCSSTVSVTVNIKALPTGSISSSTNVICSGVPSSVTLTASGGTTYQWSHGLGTGATKSVSPSATTTYTVTVTSANGCTATVGKTIAVSEDPIALLFSDEIKGACLHKITATDYTGGTGTSYLWSTGSTSNQIIVKPNAQTLYSVTVTNAVGCTSTASGLWNRPESCCTADNPALTFDSTITSTQLLAQVSSILGSGSVSGTMLMSGANQIVINGTLSLNSNLDFLGCTEIRFGANGNIKTNNFNLGCYTSTLKGCSDYMWKGIEINNAAAQVTLREFFGGKTSIYDAEFGILNTSGGKIQTFNTEFINGYRGIAVRNAMPALFEVYNTGFYSNGTLKLSTISNPIPIMNAGIEITDIFNTSANPITIGKVFSTRTNSNYFGYGSDNSLGAGIVIKDAAVKVLNSDFRISYTYGSGYVGIGSGIHAHRTTSNTMLEVGDGTPQGLNNFKTGLVGVNQAFTMNVSIRKNYFERLTTAFFVSLFNHSSNISFNDNTAYSPGVTQFGVLIGTSNNSVIEIQNNLLSFSNGSAAQTANSTGISISNSTSSSSSYRITIANNMLRQVVKGIATNNTDLPLIWGNGINIHARNYSFSNIGWAGIESTSDKGMNITQNYIDVEPVPTPNVTYTANNTTTTKIIGVNINSTRTNPAYVHCDSILNMHWALAATGANSVGVQYRRNAMMMNGTKVGLALYNPTIIGNQGSTTETNDNKWYGTVNGTTNFHFGYFATPNGSPISSQKFYFRNGYALNPTSLGAVKSDFWGVSNTPLSYNFTTPNNGIYSCYPFTQTRSGKMSEEDLQFLQWMETLVGDTLATDSLNPYFNLWREEQIMLALEENHWLREESSILYEYYYQNAGMESFLALHRLQKQADAAADSATAYRLLSENESIIPTTRHEQNIQKLNALKLRHALQLFTGNIAALYPNATDSAELRALAAECYVTGGPSIFAARAYWNVVYQKNDNSFQDYCLETTGYYKTDSVAGKGNSLELFKVFPTVIDKGNTLNILSSEMGKLKLFDISGRIIQEVSFVKGENRIQLFEFISSQIVLYDVTMSSGKKYNGKIFVK
ncbi:MAG: hypothetical protein BGO32_07805 [Bacteroidetes bacterium 37-13]|nr:MAG: hypothetical protein BGO32_07805 [Bacteroidetes bacterium 37-13]